MTDTTCDIWHSDFIPNRYTAIYRAIIERAQTEYRNRIVGAHHEHHIVPRSFYRGYSPTGWLEGDWDAPENRVLLTHREHAHCHMLLARRMTIGVAHGKMGQALRRMMDHPDLVGLIRVPSSVLGRLMTVAAETAGLTLQDHTVRDWAHLDGRTFTGTRGALEKWAGLPKGALKPLTRIKNRPKTCLGWYIVVPIEAPPLPPRERMGLSRRGKPNLKARDTKVRDWAHLDGRTFTGTRGALEKWAGLPNKALLALTGKNPYKTRLGWYIVVPGETPPLPPKVQRGLANRGKINLKNRDNTVYDWAHLDGRAYTGTRSELEAWAGLPKKALLGLTRKNPSKTARGWYIVVPTEAPPLPPREQSGLTRRRRPIKNRNIIICDRAHHER